MKFDYHWYEEGGIAVAILRHKGKEWHGTAFCHTDDLDFCSQHTGMIIAEHRATIEYYKDLKRQLRVEINAIERLKTQMISGAKCNSKSREMKVLYSELRRLKNELATVNCGLQQLRESLKEFINIKDKMYNKIRNKRKEAEQVD